MSKTGSASAAPLNRKQVFRSKREQRLQRALWLGALVVAVLVVGVIAYGLVDLYVLQPIQPAAVVNGETISVAEFQQAVRYSRYQTIQQNYLPYANNAQFRQILAERLQQIESYLSKEQAAEVGRQTLTELVNDRLIRQEAARRGITVSKEEMDKQMQEQFGYYANGTPAPTATASPFPTDVAPTVNPVSLAKVTPTPTMTPTATLEPTATPTAGPSPTPFPTETPFTAQSYAARVVTYTTELKKWTGMAEAELRRQVENQLYKDKLKAVLGANIPLEEEKVHARQILINVSDVMTDSEKLAAKTKIEEAAARLNAGEDFAILISQYASDSSSMGDMGWFGRAGSVVSDVAKLAFDTPVGSISAPMLNADGWHMIQVLGKEVRPFTAEELENKRQEIMDAWLTDQRNAKDASGQAVVKTNEDIWTKYVPTDPEIANFQ